MSILNRSISPLIPCSVRSSWKLSTTSQSEAGSATLVPELITWITHEPHSRFVAFVCLLLERFKGARRGFLPAPCQHASEKRPLRLRCSSPHQRGILVNERRRRSTHTESQ